jgi:hypothetical protein
MVYYAVGITGEENGARKGFVQAGFAPNSAR